MFTLCVVLWLLMVGHLALDGERVSATTRVQLCAALLIAVSALLPRRVQAVIHKTIVQHSCNACP